MNLPFEWKEIVRNALLEDAFTEDITTLSVIPEDITVEAKIFSRSKGVIAGLPIAAEVFSIPPSNVVFNPLVEEGEIVSHDQAIVDLQGAARVILTRERVALNFLQHLSGIATLTRKFVKQAKSVRVVDTRKTVPNLRSLQKYAVRIGGGSNHRMNLSDMVLIKDNHIMVAGSIANAIQKVREKNHKPIEVEVKSLQEVEEAVRLKPERIMLDNMDLSTMKKALKIINNQTQVEVSGNINLKNINEISNLPVDYVSIGQLTHSAPALDISLEILKFTQT